MNVEPRVEAFLRAAPVAGTPIGRLGRSRRWLPTIAVFAPAAHAAGAPDSVAKGAVARTGFMQVFDRLDPLGAALVVAAGVILVLLAIALATMVRKEKRGRPRPAPAPRRRSRTDAEPTIARVTTLAGETDWGKDPNARGVSTRAAPSTTALPALDEAVTQWTVSEVHSAATISRLPNESMGKSEDRPSPYRTAFNPYYRGDPEGPNIDFEVVEVADTLLQAELLVQLGDPKQAMTLLSNHIRETPKPGPAVWLMLLDLYQTTGRKSQYEALTVGFKTLFNAELPGWAEPKDLAARDLESYPPVLMRVRSTWGKSGIRPLIEGLLNDDRGGSRQGFTLTAYRDVLFLLEIVVQLERMAEEDAEREGIRSKLGSMV